MRRIAIDVGGTFTDVVISDASGKLAVGKGLTDRERPYTGFDEGFVNLAQDLGEDPASLLAATDVVVYGTTRATNAIVESKVAKTALLVTRGFPDILVYRQGGKHRPFELSRDFPAPYIPRSLTYEIPERISAEGGVEVELDEGAVRDVLATLADRHVEAVAVSLLWSIANNDHERRVGELIDEHLSGVPYTLSHQLNPVVREYLRTSSAAIDASLKPLMQEHLRSFQEDLVAAGFEGELLISTSGGGVMHADDVIERPINMVKSGPAMAPLAGLAYAEANELGGDVIVVDTGGTTFDVSLIRDGLIKYTRETWLIEEFVGHNLGVPTVDIRSMGAGGGSIAWIDDGGLLRVGPQSAGATPGPACYGQGGEHPTVTDAAVVLGYIDPGHFLGGRMELDVDAARTVVTKLATQLDLSLEEAASAIIKLSSEEMIKAIEQITVKDGVSPAESVLVAGGGAAGLNIVPIARALGCTRVLVPRTAGALSACGAQFSDIVAEFTGSQYAHTDHFDLEGVNDALGAIDSDMDDFEQSLRLRGIDQFERDWFVEARYLNQQWEMEAPLGVGRFTSDADVSALKGGFDTVHERLYAVNDPDGPIECMNWKGRLTAVLPKPAEPTVDNSAQKTPEPGRTAAAYFEGSGATETRVYEGAELSPGNVIEGPAIIEEPTTTVVVYAGSTCRVTPTNNYLLEVDIEADHGDIGADGEIDPVQLAIMANRLDAILREMTETVVLTARSSVIGMARDFSCGINTSDDEVLALAAGLPMHIFGTHLQCRAMKREHPDFKKGDAFLHNDPYDGNSHPADHVTLVPVFHEGEHFFTVTVKCHVADTGNSLPTTYMANARDVYEEGTLIFPCVKVQDSYEDNDDIVRMCKRRIRVPEQWHGDYLSAMGAARVGERGLEAFVAKYGKETVRRFFTEWLDYTSRRVEASIKRMPKKRLTNSGAHDPVMPFLPEGIPIKVEIDVDPDAGTVTVDLRDNPDNLPVGMNLTEATATSGAAQAVFCCLDPDIQHNAGSFRHVKVLLREGCVVGIPKFPYSCSTGTTNASDVVINLTQSAFADLGDGYGLSMANFCNSAGAGVVSGKDDRKDDAPFVNQIFIMGGGGPATPTHDGMNYVLIPPGLGLLYRDSVEIDEQRTPFLIESMRLIPDSAGAGRQRGGAGTEVIYGARRSTVTVIDICNGIKNVPRGVRGGHDAKPASNVVIRADGTEEVLDNFFLVELEAGDRIRAIDNGGSGYGAPTDRDAQRVFEDVLERYVTVEAAREVYGVVVTGDADADTLGLDEEATAALRR